MAYYDPRLRDWLEWGRRTRRWATSTCDGYHRRARHWLGWCEREKVRAPRATARDVTRWLDTLHPTAGVRIHAHTALLAWFAYQQHLGKAKRNPVRDVPRPPARRSVPRSLSPDAMRAVVEAAAGYGPRWSCFIGLLAYSGLRRTEACQIRWVDIDDDEWITVVGKGGQEATVPVHEHLRPLIVAWRSTLPDPMWVFPGRCGAMSAATATIWTRRILDDAGLPHATGHALRHGYGRRLVELGVPLPDVMGAMRHESLSSTSIYVRSRPPQVAAAVAKLDY